MSSAAETVPNYLMIANLPNEMQRKYVKRGFEFTLLVVGESGLGKTTLTNSLFNLNRQVPAASELVNKKVEIKPMSVDIEDRGVKLKLTVVETPGYGESLDSSADFKPIVNYIEEQFEKYLSHESGLNRRQIRDTRVHCCFYFISPLNYGLKPADIECMKLLQDKVNIVPLIGKADFLTAGEKQTLKKNINAELKKHQIQIYTIPDCDPDEDPAYQNHVLDLKTSVPYAVCSSLDMLDVNGRKVRGREYPWGVMSIEDPQHSDFVKLRSMLVANMEDMREVTNDLHYENYRSQRLSGAISPRFSDSIRDNISMTSGTDYGGDATERDRLLVEKEAEIRKMREQIEKMQEQIEQRKMHSATANGNGVATATANGGGDKTSLNGH